MLDVQALEAAIADDSRQAGGLAATVVACATRSGFKLTRWAANAVLVPVVTSYTLRERSR